MKGLFRLVQLLAMSGCSNPSPSEVASDGRAFRADTTCHEPPWVFDGVSFPYGEPIQRTVPKYCTRMLVKAWGAAGNSWSVGFPAGTSGGGAYAAALLEVKPGTPLWVRAGVNDKDGAGGQSSVVSFKYAPATHRFSDFVAVAAGGGGAGYAMSADLVVGDGGAGGGVQGEDGTRAVGLWTPEHPIATAGKGASQTAGGAGGRSESPGVPPGQPGLDFGSSWYTGGAGGTSMAGSGGHGWFGGGGGTSAGNGWEGGTSGSGGGGGSSYVTASALQSVLMAGHGAIPGNVGNADRGIAGEGTDAGWGQMGRIVIEWNAEPTGGDMPLGIEVNPGLANQISVDPYSSGHTARATGTGTDFSWDIVHGSATGPTDGRELSFSSIGQGGGPGQWLELAVTATVDCGEVTATRRVHTDFMDSATGPWDLYVAILRSHGITDGCTEGEFADYCPHDGVTRGELPKELLLAKEGPGYTPPLCTGLVFADVTEQDEDCAWIEELADRGVVSGCGGGNYCPADLVTREQAPVFLLATLEGGDYLPPALPSPFSDVPSNSPFSPWITELSFRGITAGCGPSVYCPTDIVTREQMAVFLVGTFELPFLP